MKLSLKLMAGDTVTNLRIVLFSEDCHKKQTLYYFIFTNFLSDFSVETTEPANWSNDNFDNSVTRKNCAHPIVICHWTASLGFCLYFALVVCLLLLPLNFFLIALFATE